MTKEDLYRFAMKDWHEKINDFYWYNGELLSGRIVMGYGEKGSISDNSYYFISPEHYNPGDPATSSLENFKQNGRPILHPDCIHFATMVHRHSNNDHVDFRERKPIKKLIIIGAGASYDFDSGQSLTGEFPITNKLFKDEQKGNPNDYQGLRMLQNELANTSNVEQFFQRKWQKLSSTFNPSLLAELISIQYYIHELFFVLSRRHRNHGRNNYSTLANSIFEYCLENPNEHIALMSYNYDTMLEQSLEQKFNFKFNKLTDYFDSSKRPFILFKPHGSADWVRRFLNVEQKGGQLLKVVHNSRDIKKYSEKFEMAERVFAESMPKTQTSLAKISSSLYNDRHHLATIFNMCYSDIEIAIPEEQELIINPNGSYIRTSAPYFPQLLIPYQDKDEFVMPQNHTVLLDRILPEIEEILVIGWKGEEKKMLEKFKMHLGKKSVKITYIKSAQEFNKASKGPTPKDIETQRNKINAEGIPVLKEVMPNSIWNILPIGFTGYATMTANGADDFFSN